MRVPKQSKGENFEKKSAFLEMFSNLCNFLDSIAQFSKKIHLFLSMGGVLPPSPPQKIPLRMRLKSTMLFY